MKQARKKFDVVVLGGINSDYTIRADALPEPGQSVRGETFHAGPGGKGANQAVAAARLGARVAIVGRVGSEARGRELARGLRKNGIDTRQVSFDPRQPSGAAIIAVRADGEKQIAVALGANGTLGLAQIRAAAGLLAQTKVLLCNFETPVRCVLAAARIAARHGAKVILDPAPPANVPDALYRLLHAIRPNSDEAAHLTGVEVRDRAGARRAAGWLRAKGVAIVALQAGDSGTLVVSDEVEFLLPELKVQTVDATGAGDAFAGALAAALAEGLPLREAAELANATAALSTTKAGAQDALPGRKAVEAFLRKHARARR